MAATLSFMRLSVCASSLTLSFDDEKMIVFESVGLGEHLADDAQLLVLVADIGRLVDRLVGFRNGDVHLGGIAQDRPGHLTYLRGQRRREHDRLPILGHIGDDLHDVLAETHVEHTVGLVEDQALDVRKVDAAVLDVRDHAPGGGDHHVRTHQHTALLHIPALAVATAVYDRGRHGQVVRKSLELLVDLLRQFARRHDDHRFYHIVFVPFDQQPVEQRQRIGRRLAGSGLGATDDVAALQDHRDGVFLDRSHLLKIHIVKSVEDLILQVKFVKSHLTFQFIISLNDFFSEQRRRGAPRNTHTHIVADVVPAAVEDHDLVLRRAARELLFVALRAPLDQHFELAPHVAQVARMPQFVLQGDDLRKPPRLHLVGHVVRQVLVREVPGRSEYLNM